MNAALLLSGGASRRMGQPKALLPFGTEPLVVAHWRALRAAGLDPLRIVVGKDARAIVQGTALARENFVLNRRHALGQLSSVQAGLAALLEDPTWPAVYLHPVDALPVSPQVIRHLVDPLTDRRILAAKPTSGGRGGHPVLLSRALCRRILRLDPRTTRLDGFLRELSEAGKVARVPVRDPLVLANLNDPDVYRRALLKLRLLPR